jgi:hypothetical protein
MNGAEECAGPVHVRDAGIPLGRWHRPVSGEETAVTFHHLIRYI